MTQSEFLIDAVLNMNKCGDVSPEERVNIAFNQLKDLVKIGCEFEEEDEEEPVKKTMTNDPYIQNVLGGGK